nr:MFS transporter [Clostridia bacterium]
MPEKKRWVFPPYVAFLLFNAVFFMMDTTNGYFQIYLNEIGLTKTMIGTITGTASLVALVFQPVFGVLTDSAKSKNRVLQGMILVSALLYPLILLNKSFIYILLVYTGYAIFRNFQHPLNTTMSVEFSEQSGRPYGPIRMMGAVGYALMMSLVGVVSAQEQGVEKTFILYSLICLLNIGLIFLLPRMKGHNRKSEGKKISPMVLLKSRPVLMLILFQILINVFTGLCRTYFGLYFTDDMGGSNQLYGTMMAVAAAIEIPFLFMADRFLRKLGPRVMLFILGVITAVRWTICFFATGTGTLFAVYCGNFINILESVTFALLLSRMVAPQLKTSVQTLSATIQNVASIFISSYLGGMLADWIGIRPLFLISGIMIAVVTVVFCGFVFKFDQTDAQTAQS